MKKIVKCFIILILIVLYLVLGHTYHAYIPCPIHYLTGYYCPGCGITRMLISTLKSNFYQAFRYNPLLFILLFPSIILFLNYLYSVYKNKRALYTKIPSMIWYILIIILVLYGILRNIFPVIAPTIVG